jgi:hypothetical protein
MLLTPKIEKTPCRANSFRSSPLERNIPKKVDIRTTNVIAGYILAIRLK